MELKLRNAEPPAIYFGDGSNWTFMELKQNYRMIMRPVKGVLIEP